MIDTNPKKIEDVLTRGVETIFPNKDFVKNLLLSGKKLKIYVGVDPTGPTLHIGHAVQLRKLRALQDLGHEIIMLIGDFTARIGDPDKLAARKKLSEKEVKDNMKLYKEQISKIINLSGKNPAKIKYNSKWLLKLNFSEIMELASKITYEQIIKRDMFQKRIAEHKPIYTHEFLYPLMQGYDSVVMEVDGEVGGSDQIFNMLIGRDLEKSILNKEKFVIANKLLEDPNGKKMGKTEGNMVALSDSADEMFGKIMSWTDGMILPGFELCTDVSMEEIKKIQKNIDDGANPRDAKVRLAKEIITIYYGADAARKAEENFVNTFKNGGVPDNIEGFYITNLTSSTAVVVGIAKAVSSKSEYRRLVEAGAVSDAVSGEKITDPDAPLKIEKEKILKIGKKKFIKLISK